MITFYNKPRTGIFNGFIKTPKIDTVEAIVEAVIIGETKDLYVTEIYESTCPMWDEMGRYETHYCHPGGFTKSRFIKWQPAKQLELF